MHQHPRPPPVTASPANSPRTNPTRTNNPRDHEEPPSRSNSVPSEMATLGGDTQEAPRQQKLSGEGKDYVAKLNQVVQNFFSKAVLIILSQRTTLEPAYSKDTGEKRVNKWFNVEIDETNELALPLQPWKTSNIAGDGPPNMILETYIETGGHGERGGLILQDERGRQWGVEDAIRSYMDTKLSGEKLPENPHVVLERWRLKLDPSPDNLPSDLDKALPKVYKHSIVLFRSLFAYVKLLPAWELHKKRHNLKPSQKIPRVKYRIYIDGQRPESATSAFDELSISLDDARLEVTDEYSFEPIYSPAGVFVANVEYRRRCDFRIEKSMESVYSSRFIGQDEELFKPSLDRFNRKNSLGTMNSGSRPSEVGSLPQAHRDLAEIAEKGQAYGSMSTFHGVTGRLSSSPLSAVRAATDKNAPSPSDDSPSGKAQTSQRSTQPSQSSVRADAAPPMGRRTSVSFMPFKTPTLSSSPLQTDKLSKPTRPSVGTSALSALAEARKPATSSQAATHTRTSSIQAETTPATSLSSSPRPTTGSRYSSSFGHRRARLSVGGSKTEDDDKTSSGKASISSSTQQPGSGVLAEPGSSGSLNTDDDNISDFLKMLDQKKDLKSFQTSSDGPSTEAATRRTNAALTKFHRLRDSNMALTDSMSSSLMLQRSSSSSSRQLSSVPPMVAGNSTSMSSSPGERMSPRTPHTPAIPSRLSANSIVEYNGRTQTHPRTTSEAEEDDGDDGEATQRYPTPIEVGAIDIPTSPRPFNPFRRSSSVAQQHRPLVDDDINEQYGMRSASMGDGEERPPLTMSELLGAGGDYTSLAVDRTDTGGRTGSHSRAGGTGYRPNRGRVGSSASGRDASSTGCDSTESTERRRGTSEERRGGRWTFGGRNHPVDREQDRSGDGESGYEEDEGMLFTMN